MRKALGLLLILFALPLAAQNRQSVPRLEARDEFRVPVTSDCTRLTNQRIGDLCFDTDVDLDNSGAAEGKLYQYTGSSWIPINRAYTGAAPPATCSAGEIYYDSTPAFQVCASGIWDSVAGGGGGSGDIESVFDCLTGACVNIDATGTQSLDMSGIDASTTTEGLFLPQGNDCSAATAEGQVCWDDDNNLLYIGDGATALTVALDTEDVEDIVGAMLNDGTGTYTGISITYQDFTSDFDIVVDHDTAQNFDANKHVDHTAVTLTAGAGLDDTGTGDITASRTFATDSTEGAFLTDGGAVSLTCGGGPWGQMQVMDDGALQYCDGAGVLQDGYVIGSAFWLDNWIQGGDGIDTQYSAPNLILKTDSSESNFLADLDGITPTCGPATQGIIGVISDGALEFCDGTTSSVRQTGTLTGSAAAAGTGTPPTLTCNEAGEAGRIFVKTDASQYGRVYTCGGVGGWELESIYPLTSGSDGDSSTTASDSGLEIVGGQFTLLRGCGDDNILKWNEATDDWNCEADVASGGGGITFTMDDANTTSSATIDMTGGTGIVSSEPAADDIAFGLDYTSTIAGDPALNAEECVFTTDGTGGGILCEGSSADTNEGLLSWNPSSDITLTLPDATDTVVARATTDTLTNKTLDGGATGNDLSLRDSADCDALTDGVAGEPCYDTTSDSIWVCEPTAGGCDTPGEWIEAGGGGGGNGFGTIGTAVADSAADTLTITDSLAIDLVTTDGPEDLSADFLYTATQAGDPAMGAEETIFTTDGTGGGLLFEGVAADANEGLLQWNPTTDKVLTLPDATDTIVGRATTDTLTNKTLTTPTIADFTNMVHTHTSAAQGGAAGGNIPLTTGTTGNYVAGVSDGNLGVSVSGSGSEGASVLVQLRYTTTRAGNPAWAAKQCAFTVEGTSGGGFLCEGTTANNNEQLYIFPAVDGADTVNYIPVDDKQVTDLEGTGLSITTGTLNVGGLTTSEITDNTIIEPDLSLSNSPSATGDILTYNATGTRFTWITQNAGTDITADLEEEDHCSEHSSTDLSCVGQTLIVTDDQHNHTSTSISGLQDADLGGGGDDDFGDFSCTGAEDQCTIDSGVIVLASMSTVDHGDVTWATGSAVVENVQCTGCVGDADIDNAAVTLDNITQITLRDIDNLQGLTDIDSNFTFDGALIDLDTGTAESRLLLANSTTPPATCTVGELYFDTDEDSGSVMMCRTTNNWVDVDDDGGAGGFVSFDLDDGTTQQIISSLDTITFADGTGIDLVVSATDTVTAGFDYSKGLTDDVVWNAEECAFTTDGAGGGGFLCEGTADGNTNEQLYLFPAVDGANTTSFIAVDNEQVTDMEGTGLDITAGVLSATLGTTIVTGDITDGTILEPDSSESSGTPTDGDLLTYNSGGTNFTWVAPNSGATAGAIIVGTGVDTAAWDTTPTLVDTLTLDAGSGDSPTLRLTENTGSIDYDIFAQASDSRLYIQATDVANNTQVELVNPDATYMMNLAVEGSVRAKFGDGDNYFVLGSPNTDVDKCLRWDNTVDHTICYDETTDDRFELTRRLQMPNLTFGDTTMDADDTTTRGITWDYATFDDTLNFDPTATRFEFSDDVHITGDLETTGTSLKLGTNTSAYILVADGTDFSPVPMGGVVAMSSGGSTSITDGSITENDFVASLVFDNGDVVNLSPIVTASSTAGLFLPQNATACSAATGEGQICWDATGDDLYVGDGAAGVVQINVGFTGLSLAGSSGTPEPVADGDTITIAGTSPITTVVATADTVTVDFVHEVVANETVTWGGGGSATIPWTWDVTGTTDPVLTFSDGEIMMNTALEGPDAEATWTIRADKQLTFVADYDNSNIDGPASADFVWAHNALDDTNPIMTLDEDGLLSFLAQASTAGIDNASGVDFTFDVDSIADANNTSLNFTFTDAQGAITIGDGGSSNYLNITSGGVMTAVGTASITADTITSGTNPTVSAVGEIAVDTTDDQLVYSDGSNTIVLHPTYSACAVLENFADADDSYEIFMAGDAITVTGVSCHCHLGAGSICTTAAIISLEDRGGNAMTHGGNVTCSKTASNSTFTAVTAGNSLGLGEGLAFDVDTAPGPDATDTYSVCFTYTFDRQ